MNQKSKTDLNYESIVNGRPLSEQGIDIHVYLVPLSLWRDHLRSADSQTVITEAISAGFVRVMPDSIVNSLRIDIENQLGFETVPRNFVFLRCVGRCFTVIKAKQEYSIKAKNFTPPETFAPDIFLMELTSDIRSILTSSQSNQSLKKDRGQQKHNSHMTTPHHHKPNKSEGVLHPHLNDSRLTGSLSEEEEDVDEENEKEKDGDRRPSQVKRQLTVTKTSAAATGDYILTPNSKFTQTMEENNADKKDTENRMRLKRKEDEERRKEMLRRLALEQQREEQRKSEEMARKEAEAKREEELRKKQEEELRKRLGEEDRNRLEEEERKWLEEVNRRQLEKRRKQEEELRKKLEEEQRRRKEEEMRRKQEEEVLRKRQEDELKKKLEEQQKRMTNEEFRRRLEEELGRKQDEERRRNHEEELRRKLEEELRRKQEEERRGNQGEELQRWQEEELKRKQDEERRRKQEEDQRRKQDELNWKKDEVERKKMSAEEQKAADKAALRKEIERLREDRKMQELKRDELTKKVKSLQERSQLNQNSARDSWRKRYLDEKKKTPPLNSDCSQLKKDLNAINKKILSNVESTSHVINHGANQKPSEKSNLKIQAIRLRMEIEDLKSRLDNMNMKLTAELKLRTQAEDELQLLRKNQFTRKKEKPLSIVHVKQTPTPGRGGGGRGGATGRGKAVGSQRGLNSMQQLPPVA